MMRYKRWRNKIWCRGSGRGGGRGGRGGGGGGGGKRGVKLEFFN